MHNQAEHPTLYISHPLPSAHVDNFITAFDQKFLQPFSYAQLFHLLAAASYMNIPLLFQLLRAYVAEMLRTESQDKLASALGVTADHAFSSAERIYLDSHPF